MFKYIIFFILEKELLHILLQGSKSFLYTRSYIFTFIMLLNGLSQTKMTYNLTLRTGKTKTNE